MLSLRERKRSLVSNFAGLGLEAKVETKAKAKDRSRSWSRKKFAVLVLVSDESVSTTALEKEAWSTQLSSLSSGRASEVYLKLRKKKRWIMKVLNLRC